MNARPGVLWVCRVCGGTSPTVSGEPDGPRTATDGWDQHCAASSVALREDSLVRTPSGKVVGHRGGLVGGGT